MSERRMYWIILALAVGLAVAVTGWYKSDRVLSLEATIQKQNTLMASVADLVRSVPGWSQGYAQQFRRLGVNVPDPPPKQAAKPPTEGTGNGQ